MKKLLIAVIIVLAVALLIFLAFGLSMQNKASVGIIGGADGPTAILVTGSILTTLAPIIAIILIAAVVIGIVLHKKKK